MVAGRGRRRRRRHQHARLRPRGRRRLRRRRPAGRRLVPRRRARDGARAVARRLAEGATIPAFRAAVADVERRLEQHEARARTSRARTAPTAAISEDGRSALVSFEIAGQGRRRGGRPRGRHAGRHRGRPARATPSCGSSSSATPARTRRSARSSRTTSRRPRSPRCRSRCVILVLAFGALVAAGVPLLLAISAVAATIGLLGPISQIAPVDESIASVILLIGLAVGVDYSLFYLRREREERAAGRDEQAALLAAAATSGPRGADLRLHGDDRHGRHVHRRRAHVPVVRHRHDPGGGDRDVRLAHRAARGAVEAGRPRRQGPDPVPAPPARPRPREDASGRGS